MKIADYKMLQPYFFVDIIGVKFWVGVFYPLKFWMDKKCAAGMQYRTPRCTLSQHVKG